MVFVPLSTFYFYERLWRHPALPGLFLLTVLLLAISTQETAQHAGEFHGEDILCGWAGANGFECVEVLQGHGLLIDRLRGVEDRFERLRKAFGAQELGLAGAFSLQDDCLLLTFCL